MNIPLIFVIFLFLLLLCVCMCMCVCVCVCVSVRTCSKEIIDSFLFEKTLMLAFSGTSLKQDLSNLA